MRARPLKRQVGGPADKIRRWTKRVKVNVVPVLTDTYGFPKDAAGDFNPNTGEIREHQKAVGIPKFHKEVVTHETTHRHQFLANLTSKERKALERTWEMGPKYEKAVRLLETVDGLNMGGSYNTQVREFEERLNKLSPKERMQARKDLKRLHTLYQHPLIKKYPFGFSDEPEAVKKVRKEIDQINDRIPREVTRQDYTNQFRRWYREAKKKARNISIEDIIQARNIKDQYEKMLEKGQIVKGKKYVDEKESPKDRLIKRTEYEIIEPFAHYFGRMDDTRNTFYSKRKERLHSKAMKSLRHPLYTSPETKTRLYSQIRMLDRILSNARLNNKRLFTQREISNIVLSFEHVSRDLVNPENEIRQIGRRPEEFIRRLVAAKSQGVPLHQATREFIAEMNWKRGHMFSRS